MEITAISRFHLRQGSGTKLTCSCGAVKLTAGVRRGQVWLEVPCYLCDGVHMLHFSPRRFWRADLKHVACQETGLQLGVCGDAEQVELYLSAGGSELDRFLEDEAFGEYFDDPVVMYHALSCVNQLAEQGNLSCCCGNRHIAVDIYPERLELCCSECGRQKIVPANSEADLAELQHARRIEVR